MRSGRVVKESSLRRLQAQIWLFEQGVQTKKRAGFGQFMCGKYKDFKPQGCDYLPRDRSKN
jgi:hypothetical protein